MTTVEAGDEEVEEDEAQDEFADHLNGLVQPKVRARALHALDPLALVTGEERANALAPPTGLAAVTAEWRAAQGRRVGARRSPHASTCTACKSTSVILQRREFPFPWSQLTNGHVTVARRRSC